MTDSRPTLPFLETMITQVCNLSCLGCTNYSDLDHKGYVTWQAGLDMITPWLDRVSVPDFGIMGGEPLINPECGDWLIGMRRLLPHSQIRFTTNGLLLHKHMHLVDLMHDLGNFSFKITVHESNPGLEDLIAEIFNKFDWNPVREYGIDRWKTSNEFRFAVKRPEHFVKTYRNDYANMLPWRSDPDLAFANCCQQTCPLLYQGRIYKCSTAGLLESTVTRMAPHLHHEWQEFFDPGLSPDCDQDALAAFIDNFGHPHQRCGQCPTADQAQSTLRHVDFVRRK